MSERVYNAFLHKLTKLNRPDLKAKIPGIVLHFIRGTEKNVNE